VETIPKAPAGHPLVIREGAGVVRAEKFAK
jgi:hypothetical protein